MVKAKILGLRGRSHGQGVLRLFLTAAFASKTRCQRPADHSRGVVQLQASGPTPASCCSCRRRGATYSEPARPALRYLPAVYSCRFGGVPQGVLAWQWPERCLVGGCRA